MQAAEDRATRAPVPARDEEAGWAVWAAVRGPVAVPVAERAVWAPGPARAEGVVRDRVVAVGQVWVLVRGRVAASGWVAASGRAVASGREVSAPVPDPGSVAVSEWAVLVPDPGRGARAPGSAVRVPARGAVPVPVPAAAAGSALAQAARTRWAFATVWEAG
ncbi:hypothetical protein ACQPZQ_21805 [Pseudonocardia sp. CA-142604]|uniref:hypothetical protein n=1 Tax=Pseudonocardia sp. CA-142604 TaxID=3240024 RepID=UPI003D8F9C20